MKDSYRDEQTLPLLDDFLQDVRYTFRQLRNSPGFTAAALLTLALGIGATSAVFSVVRTVMLDPLPYHDPDRIVAVWETNRGGTSRNVIAPANFVAWRERTRTLEHLGMVGPTNLVLIFEVEPLDPTTFAATSLALLTIATVAAYIPARRSMRMAPVDALRTD